MTVQMPRFLVVPVRLLFAWFFVVTAIYCLLAYIPFTYEQVVAGKLFTWLVWFVKLYPFLYFALLLLVALTLLPDLELPKVRYLVIAFVAVLALSGIALLFHPLLPSLRNDWGSLVWSVLSLLPIGWLAAIDWLGQWPRIVWSNRASHEDGRVFLSAFLSALFLPVVYAMVYFVRSSRGWAPILAGDSGWLSLEWSLVSHLIVFTAVFLIWDFVVSVSRMTGRPPKVEFLLATGLALIVVWMTIKFVVFLPLSFAGIRGTLVAFAFGATLVAFLVGLSLRMYRLEDGALQAGLGLLLMPGRVLRTASWTGRVCFLLMIPGIAYFLQEEAGAMDWGFLGQKSAVILVWILTMATIYTVLPDKLQVRKRIAMYGVAAVVLGTHMSLVRGEASRLYMNPAHQDTTKMLLDNYADFDISFRLARGLAAGSEGGILMQSPARDQFYSFLGENTDIPRSDHIQPVPINLVAKLSASPGPKPNVFIIVIDSLRRDYLSPYNSSVTFTPSMGSFARESITMENSFTQYGGTGLSEPCIWSGSLLLHQQYTTPFYPMNSLEKLLETEGYQSYISVDEILSKILGPSLPLDDLDKGRNMDLDLCRTISTLDGRLSRASDRTKPVFAYTQPQNIHVSVINREERSVPPGEVYPGFDPAVASRLKRIDGCFGEFVRFLKKTGLYENSIVILTSDHGDSLGEGGRMGHAYTIFPEIVRVPLIVHLPSSLKAGNGFDPNSVAFLTDITPTLYSLLGHQPIVRNGLFGRPLFTKEADGQNTDPETSKLIASSYGPVYGILSEGRFLYIADGINYRDYLFDLIGGRNDVERPLSEAMRADYREKIIRDILRIDQFYGFRPKTLLPPNMGAPAD